MGRFVTWLVVIIIFLVLFSKIEVAGVADALRHVNKTLFFASLLISLVAQFAISPALYRAILRMLGCGLTFSEAAVIKLGSIPLKASLPFKMGELVKVAYLKKIHDLPYAMGLYSLIIGYAVAFSIQLAIILSGWLLAHLSLARAISLAAFFLMLLMIVVYVTLQGSVNFIIRFVKRIYREQGNVEMTKQGGFHGNFAPVVFYSLLFECCKLLAIFMLFRAFGIYIPAPSFLVFATLSLFVSDLPLTPWGLGMRETSVVTLFSGYSAPETLLASSMAMSFVNRVFPALICLLIMRPFLLRLSSSITTDQI